MSLPCIARMLRLPGPGVLVRFETRLKLPPVSTPPERMFVGETCRLNAPPVWMTVTLRGAKAVPTLDRTWSSQVEVAFVIV